MQVSCVFGSFAFRASVSVMPPRTDDDEQNVRSDATSRTSERVNFFFRMANNCFRRASQAPSLPTRLLYGGTEANRTRKTFLFRLTLPFSLFISLGSIPQSHIKFSRQQQNLPAAARCRTLKRAAHCVYYRLADSPIQRDPDISVRFQTGIAVDLGVRSII